MIVWDESELLNGADALVRELGREQCPTSAHNLSEYSRMRFLIECNGAEDYGRRDDIDHVAAEQAVMEICPDCPRNYFDWVRRKLAADNPEQVGRWADDLIEAVDLSLKQYAVHLPDDEAQLLLQKGREVNRKIANKLLATRRTL